MLYDQLRQHPEVFMCPEKEPAYFTRYWETRDLAWYESLFAERRAEPAVGEATVEYMVDPAAVDRIRRTLPKVRFVFILRDPVERAWSHYWHRVKMGIERRPFSSIINEGDHASYPIRYGLYAEHVRRFREVFAEEQLLVVILEELIVDASDGLAQICRFLGVSPPHDPVELLRSNESAMPRSAALARAAARVRSADQAKASLPDWLLRPLRGAFRWMNDRNTQPWRYPALDAASRRTLEDVFAQTIADMEALTGREIPAWSSEVAVAPDE